MKIRSALGSFPRFLLVALLTTGFGGVSRLHAQTIIPSRITAPINENAPVRLRGNVHPLARAEFDRGAAPVSLPAERMLLLLKRAPEQQKALDEYLRALQDPTSPSYHKFITPEEFGKLYGPADADIQTVTNWLQGHGFQVNQISKGRTALEFSGSVGQVQGTFQTSIHSFIVHGQQHWANTTDPSIPTALAPVIAGLSPLNNFTARPNSTRAPSATYDPSTHTVTPLLTSTSGGNFLYVGPADAATIYNTPNASLNLNYSSTTPSYDGSGITIAVAGVSQINTSDVDHYRTIFGLPANTPQVIVDGTDPGHNDAEDEALLDLEISGALAPGAKTILYTAASTTLQDGLFLAITRALQDNTASILNVSFGNCEAAFGNSGNQYISSLWEQAAAQGISVTVSTGDSGSAGCDDPNAVTVASKGLGVNGLASSPYNIAVGGTDYTTLPTNFLTYASTTNRQGTRGSALKYIPEGPWNDSTSFDGKLAQNSPLTDKNGAKNIWGGGGGVSIYYTKPAWQKNVTPQDGVRDLPDVSLLAADGLYSATWAVCASPYVNSSGVTITDCVPNTSTNTYYLSGFGGTSTSAPAFAGMLALVQQSVGHRLGQANSVLYKLSQTAPAVFHDVTTGNISVYCSGGTAANCGTNSFLTGYDAGTGYDLASGLGSVDATAMIKNWASAGLSASTTTLSLSQTTFTHGTPVTINIGVSGSGGTPTGDVGLVSSNTSADAGGLGFLTLGTSGTASTSYSYFPGGSYSVSANYGGDTIFSGSASPAVQITVAPEASTLQLTAQTIVGNNLVSVANTSFPYGTYVSVDATPIGQSQKGQTSPTPLGTGSVTFTDTHAPVTASTVAVNSNGSAELPIYSYDPGPHSISAVYSGDASFTGSSGGPVAFTVTDAALSAASTSLALSAGQSKPVTLTLTPSNGFSGTVSLSCAFTAGPTNAVSIPTCSISPATVAISGTSSASATLTIATSTTKSGAVHYPGWITSGGGAVLACLLFFGIPARRSSWRAIVSLLFFVGVISATGCGGGGSSTTGSTSGGTTGTTPGNYTVTVTSSTNGSVMHKLDIPVTVN
ncbi:MAG TPA: protease pro-enzyme activation domain-containing protein [Acidisarcina sp.]|nr:protease pro-enzyme activation domain-containing protein [Acidisarcina sp.]